MWFIRGMVIVCVVGMMVVAVERRVRKNGKMEEVLGEKS